MISYIVAAYNESKNIENCVRNLLIDFIEGSEIIIIDDGSKDDTWKKCQKLAKRHPEVKIFHQMNAGVAMARNFGLARANNPWITFVDADDAVVNIGLKRMLEKAEESHADLIIGAQSNSSEYYSDEDRYMELTGEKLQLYALNKVRYRNCMLGSIHGCYGKLYRSSIAKSVGFINGLGLGEDMLFVMGVLKESKKIITTNIRCYTICYNTMSSTRRLNEKMVDYAVKFIESSRALEDSNRDTVYVQELNYQRFHHFDVGVGGFLTHTDNRMPYSQRIKMCKEAGDRCRISEVCNLADLNNPVLSVYEANSIRALRKNDYSLYLWIQLIRMFNMRIKKDIKSLLKRGG